MTYDYQGEITVTGKRRRGPPYDDTVSIVDGATTISGWQSVRITRGIEICPSSFDIGMTEHFPEVADVAISPGDPCKVLIGTDTVITGYVDIYAPKISAGSHTVRIVGRGKCEDLVDCSAEWPGGQISGNSALGIAQKLAMPYGIDVALGPGVTTATPIQQFNLQYGETAWSIIERVARYQQLLAYEDVDGNLVLSQVGSAAAASGFVQGVNIEDADIAYRLDERYSEIRVMRQSMDLLGDIGQGENLPSIVYDKFVPRHRRLDLISESGAGGADVGMRRALWEMSRRYGRSFELHLTTDSWRDSAGALWEPNTIVPAITIPALKLAVSGWVIGEVTYRKDENGTHADLVIMPPQAFQPEPLLQPQAYADVPPGVAQSQ